VLYWSENLIIGVFTILKMIAVAPVGGWFASAFFLVHYGGFCAVHGMFVLMLALGEDMGGGLLDGESWPLFLVFVQLLVGVVARVLEIAPPHWLLVFAALGVSHGLSLLANFFYGGEYRQTTTKSLMAAPYKRIVILHVAIIVGAFGVAAVDSPLPLLVLLVAMKLVLDVWLHLREHRLVAGEALPDLELLQLRRQPVLIGIRHRHDFGFRHAEPHGVETVSVIAPSGVADDGDARLGSGARSAGAQGETGGGSGEEVAAVHDAVWQSGEKSRTEHPMPMHQEEMRITREMPEPP
jgi:hypothetical protein